jgi:predicted lysophospholipase L1 biosynthesis ABC-type transport system permease subunit
VPAHACEVPARSLRSVGNPLQRACKVPATRLLRFSETPTRLTLLEGVARRPKQAVLCFAFFSGSLMLLSAIFTALVSTVAPRPSSHT